jgi:hypothetical protein
MLAECKLSQNKQDEKRCTSNEKLLHIFEYYGCKEVYRDKEQCYAWYRSLQQNCKVSTETLDSFYHMDCMYAVLKHTNYGV